MVNTSSSTSMVSVGSSELGGMQASDMVQQPNPIHQNRVTPDGPVAILWDMENCPVPSDVRPEDVGGNIRMALQVHPVIKGAVIMFSAYGDFNAFPRRLREGCQRTGVKLVDVPNGRKDAADKAILVDMFLFALDNPPPSSIMLISGDVDFAPALHILGQRGYTIILVIPSGVGVSSALCNAGRFVWDWPSVSRGEGFVPASKSFMSPHGLPGELCHMGCHVNESPEYQNEEEAIIYRGVSRSSMDVSSVPDSSAECSSGNLLNYPTAMRAQSLPNGLSDAPAGYPAAYDDQYSSTMWVQPGDVNGLKVQVVKLLELFSGSLPLTRIPSEYQKMYGRPLYVSEYGAFKLVNLLRKMNDVISIDGKGQRKFVCLRNWKAGPSATPLSVVVDPSSLAKKDSKGKGAQEGLEVVAGNGFVSSDEFSDEDRVGVEELEERRSPVIQTSTAAHVARCEAGDGGCLERFKFELQEIIVSYSCRIFLGSFEAIYQQRYKKTLDLGCFGVTRLEELFDRVRDVVVLHEDPTSKRKFVDAVGG